MVIKKGNILIYKFLIISFNEKKMFFEAFTLYLFVELLMLLFPFRFYSNFIGNYMKQVELNNNDSNLASLVLIAIKRALKILPYKPKCLVNSIVAKKMLDKRGIKSILFLGLNKNINNKLYAHAWLKISNFSYFIPLNLQSEYNTKQFKVIAFFS